MNIKTKKGTAKELIIFISIIIVSVLFYGGILIFNNYILHQIDRQRLMINVNKHKADSLFSTIKPDSLWEARMHAIHKSMIKKFSNTPANFDDFAKWVRDDDGAIITIHDVLSPEYEIPPYDSLKADLDILSISSTHQDTLNYRKRQLLIQDNVLYKKKLYEYYFQIVDDYEKVQFTLVVFFGLCLVLLIIFFKRLLAKIKMMIATVTYSSKKTFMIVAIMIIGILIITNPSMRQFEEYKGYKSKQFRRMQNWLIFSIYEDKEHTYFAVFNNFIN